MPEPKVVPESPAEWAASVTVGSPATAEEAVEATRKEYSQYVAPDPIYVGTALAFNKGDAIPASTVERLGWASEGKAIKVGTKAHKELRESMGLPPLES